MVEQRRPGKLVVAITGASGSIFGVRILERLAELEVESHLVVTGWGLRTLQHEVGLRLPDLAALATVVHKSTDQGASVSSGSFQTDGMIVAPCSVKTLAGIASGYAADLVTRAADVTLKERRPLVLLVREAPLSEVHLENMLKLARMGAVMMPPVAAFYNHPRSVDDIVDHVVARTFDQLGLHLPSAARWNGMPDSVVGD